MAAYIILALHCAYIMWVECIFQASGPLKLTLSNYNVLNFILLIQNDVRNSALQMASVEQRKADVNVLRLVEEQKVSFIIMFLPPCSSLSLCVCIYFLSKDISAYGSCKTCKLGFLPLLLAQS